MSPRRLYRRGTNRSAHPALSLTAVAVAATVAVGVASGSTTAKGFPDKQIMTVTFTGVTDNVYHGPSITSWVKHIEWSLRWTGTVREMRLGHPVFTIVKLKGAITAKFADTAVGSCAATLRKRPGVEIRMLGSASPGGETLGARSVTPITAQYLKSSSESEAACGSNAALGGIYRGSPALRPRVELRFGSGRSLVFKTFTASYDGPGTGGGRERDRLESKLTLKLGAGPP